MKKMYMLNNSKDVIRTLVGLKSRMTMYLPRYTHDSILSRICLVSLILLIVGGFSTKVWGGKKCQGTITIIDGKGKVEIDAYYKSWGSWYHTIDSTRTLNTAKTVSNTGRGNTDDGYVKFTATASTGYTFYGWCEKSDCTDATPDLTNSKTYENKTTIKKDLSVTLYTKFTANSYDVTLAPNGGSGSNQTIRATFDSGMPATLKAGGAVVAPSKTGYTFTGYYDSGNTKYYNSDLSSARNWDKASTATLSAHWSANEYTITLTAGSGITSAGTPSITATFDVSTNLTSAITTPTKDKNVFDGYYTGANGTGTQIIDAFGNVIAQAGGDDTYTDASKNWKYANDIELHANWIAKYDFEITGSNYTINNEAWTQTTAFNFVHADEEHMTTTIEKTDVISYNRGSNTITALKIGTSKITFTQNTSSTVNNGEIEFTITVDSVENTLAVSNTSFTRYVEQDIANIRSGENSNGTISTTSTNPTLAHYNIASNTIEIPNSDAQVLPFEDVTITIFQAATAKYKYKKHTITLTVQKYTPEFAWNTQANYYYNTTVNNFLTKTTGGSYTVTPSDEEIASMDGADLKIYNKPGTVKIKYVHPETYYWAEKKDSVTFTPGWKNDQLPITSLISSNASTYGLTLYGKYEGWETKSGVEGITLCDGTWLTSRPEGYAIFHFTGIPDKINFTTSCVDVAGQYPAKSDYMFEVYESADDSTWTKIWNCDNSVKFADSENKDASRSVALSSTTRYIKLRYHGACWGRFTNISVTKREEFRTSVDELDFGAYQINKPAESKTFKFYHASAGYITSIVSDDDHFTVSPASVTTGGEVCDSAVITVNYRTDDEGEHSGTITISDNIGNTTSVSVTGTTQGLLATHLVYIGKASYSVDTTNIGVANLFEVRDANNALVAGATITLGTSDEEVDIVGTPNAVDPICSGTVTITASYAGDNGVKYAAAEDLEQEITINEIDDEVSFENGKSVMLKDDEYTLSDWASAISGTAITYTSDNESVLKVEDGKLKAVGSGNATLTATSAGNCVYNAGSKTLKIKVRNADDPCQTLLLDKADKLKINAYSSKVTYTIPEGPQDKLTFKVWKYSGATWNANVYIKNASGTQLKKYTYESGSLSTSEPDDANVTIDLTDAELAGAKTIEIDGSGTLYKYISDLKVSQKAYLTASTSSVTMNANVCETATGEFTVSYSDVSRIQLSQTNENFTYEVWDGETKLDGFNNDCGEYGTYTVKFFYTPQTPGEEYSNTVTLSASGLTQTITLSGVAGKGDREIVWDGFEASNTITAGQSIDLEAYAQDLCEHEAGSVSYTISPATEGVTTRVGNNVTFNKAGVTVTITANTVVSEDYNAAEAVTKTWTVDSIASTLEWTIAPTSFAKTAEGIVFTAASDNSEGAITYKITEGDEYASIHATTGALTITAEGEITVKATIAANGNYATKSITTTASITAAKTYTGDGAWGESKWSATPEDGDDVIINGNVTISTEVEVNSLTINENKSITVKNGGVLRVSGRSGACTTYGDIRVENGGKVELGVSANLQVNDFVLEAKLGNTSNAAASGQVSGASNLNVNGDAYFDLTIDPSGQCSAGWYTFTVPFPVDALNGVTRFNRSTGEEYSITNEENYAIMDYSENRRVENGYGWKKYRGILQPGKCYTMTIDSYDPKYRFKKTADGAFNTTMTETLAYTDGDNPARGWNGLGNGTLAHTELSAVGIEKVQIYNHSTNSYDGVDIGIYTYAVGSAYFVQAPTASTVVEYTHSATNPLRAPSRERGVSEFQLTLTREGDSNFADRLYVGADEEALNEYEIGRDLTKFGTPTDAKVAQIWASAYGMQLCDIDMPLTNDAASCELGMFAPKAGAYTLAIKAAPSDATLYLTYEGNIIWDLTMSAYEFDLSKGTTEGYGLLLEAKKAPKVATGVEDVQQSDLNVQKIIRNGHVYILRDGQMYDVTGRNVR